MTSSSTILEESELAYFHWRPRPDQPSRFDQQSAFYRSQLPGVAFLIGGNGAGTTESVIAKIAKFVLRDQPPPRHDTPFWVIAGSYEQVMEVAWKEKLFGHGHIPPCEIDEARIQWYRPNANWPYRVPLKSWPGRPSKNWVLEFKSYEQGRAQMQARSIGGFAFIEQFPWGILEEVLRGCREYNFPGAKFCEFTPVDPMLSMPLQEMMESGELPDGWEVFRMNTECAKEAGHVSAEWFDEFFGMVPDEMREVRMTGAFASFEGLIYQGFSPQLHLVDDEFITFPEGVHYRRAIDWGAGPENAFCCLWAYRDGLGRWFIFDEYYSTNQNYTTADHLKDIADRTPWPASDPHYGVTWADPSSPDHIRLAQKLSQYIPGVPDLSVMPARNAVYEGIDYVRHCLKSTPARGGPGLFIHKKNCPNLAMQMQTYRWERGSDRGANPRDAKPHPLKKNDHACFPAGQMVSTPNGPIPIENISPGDVVNTHLGIGIVQESRHTGTRHLVHLDIEGNAGITCTPDHPVALHDGGWIPASEAFLKTIDVELNDRFIRREHYESGDAAVRREYRRQGVRPAKVVGVRVMVTDDVYNLATSDGTFFVNGVLVSNCDALRYLVFSDSDGEFRPSQIVRPDNSKRHGVQLRRK